jgi:predicted nucleic acid-binding protein
VDSNVLIDIATNDPVWAAWSAATLTRLADTCPLILNPIIYAEVSISYAHIADVELALPPDLFRRESLPYDAAFLAGKCFQAYRRRGGARHAPLPDFYIGAHAVVAGYRLLTRDSSRYRTYFPTLPVIAPADQRD